MRAVLGLSTMIPLAIPPTAVGISLIRIWNTPLTDIVYSGSAMVILGYVFRFLPFSVIILGSELRQLNPRSEESARLACPNWLGVMRRITLPLAKTGLLTGFMVVFILAFGELGTTLLLIPPGRETLPIRIYNLMHYGAHDLVSALCLISLALTFALSGVFLIIWKKNHDKYL